MLKIETKLRNRFLKNEEIVRESKVNKLETLNFKKINERTWKNLKIFV